MLVEEDRVVATHIDLVVASSSPDGLAYRVAGFQAVRCCVHMLPLPARASINAHAGYRCWLMVKPILADDSIWSIPLAAVFLILLW